MFLTGYRTYVVFVTRLIEVVRELTFLSSFIPNISGKSFKAMRRKLRLSMNLIDRFGMSMNMIFALRLFMQYGLIPRSINHFKTK